uniref:Uncharacterized protein n=1 Tax=Panagrolaimus sp. JU765 TaxID=591449 RepID=A0AC34R0Y7_9BILA
MTAMPATNKFLKYSIYAILVMLIVLIGLSIAQLVLDATQGGGPSMDEMCDYFPPGMCGPPAGGNGTNSSTPAPTQVSEAIKKAIENIDVNTVSEGALKARHFYDTCMDTKSIQENKGKVLGKLLHTGIPEDPILAQFGAGDLVVDAVHVAVGSGDVPAAVLPESAVQMWVFVPNLGKAPFQM